MTVPRSFISIVAVSAAIGGCALLGGGQANTAQPPPSGAQTSERTEAYAAGQANLCEEHVDEAKTKLTAALRLAGGQGTMPDKKPVAPSAELITTIRKLGIELELQPAESPDGTVAEGFLILTDSLGDEARHFMEHPPKTKAQRRKLEKFSRKATKGVGPINGLRYQIIEVGGAYYQANTASQMCNVYAFGSATFVQNMNRFASLRPNMAAERDALGRIVKAADAADAMAAASMGLVATYQAVIEGDRDPTVIAQTVSDLGGALPFQQTADVSDEVDATLALAKAELDKTLAEQADAQAQLAAQANAAPAAAPAGPPKPARLQAGGKNLGKAAAVLGVVSAVASRDYGAAVSGVASLMPEDSPLRHGLAGAGAVMRGDFVGALQSASRLAPKGSKVGGVMQRVLGRVGTLRKAAVRRGRILASAGRPVVD